MKKQLLMFTFLLGYAAFGYGSAGDSQSAFDVLKGCATGREVSSLVQQAAQAVLDSDTFNEFLRGQSNSLGVKNTLQTLADGEIVNQAAALGQAKVLLGNFTGGDITFTPSGGSYSPPLPLTTRTGPRQFPSPLQSAPLTAAPSTFSTVYDGFGEGMTPNPAQQTAAQQLYNGFEWKDQWADQGSVLQKLQRGESLDVADMDTWKVLIGDDSHKNFVVTLSSVAPSSSAVSSSTERGGDVDPKRGKAGPGDDDVVIFPASKQKKGRLQKMGDSAREKWNNACSTVASWKLLDRSDAAMMLAGPGCLVAVASRLGYFAYNKYQEFKDETREKDSISKWWIVPSVPAGYAVWRMTKLYGWKGCKEFANPRYWSENWSIFTTGTV